MRELRFTKFPFKLQEERFSTLVGKRKFDILFIVFSPYHYKRDDVHLSFSKDNYQYTRSIEWVLLRKITL